MSPPNSAKPLGFRILNRLALLLAVTGLAGCAPPGGKTSTNANPTSGPGATTLADPSRPIQVLATTTMVADVVKAVGGPRVQVDTLIGAGLDPHLYKARESDLRKLTDAELVFFSGLNLEARMGDVLRQHRAPLGDSVAIAEAIPHDKLRIKGEGHTAIDPHVWMDPALWSFTADSVERTLAEVDPPNAADYAARSREWKAGLGKLTTEIQGIYDGVPKDRRILVTAHDAFGYLGAAFGLDVRGLQGVSTAMEAGAADVDALATFLVEKKVKTVFAETSVPTRGLEALMQAVKARGGTLVIGPELLSDSLARADQPGGTYAGMMRQNAERIISGLTPDPPPTTGAPQP